MRIVVHDQALDKRAVPQEAIAEIESMARQTLTKGQGCYYAQLEKPLSVEQLQDLRGRYRIDLNQIPVDLEISLLISDMDSTLIEIECIDEIADFANRKAEVAAVTEAAMRGEIDFNTSLVQRVSALKGLSVDVLEQVYEHRLRLNPGARELIQGLKKHQIKTALVSGGFTFFAAQVKEDLDLDFCLANELEVVDGRLTGQVIGEIVNADVKARFLREICQETGIQTGQSIAVGDGANDLKMMHQAAVGVAYHAKPKVQEQANMVLNYHGLDAILHLVSGERA